MGTGALAVHDSIALLFRWAQADPELQELDDELREHLERKPRNTSQMGWHRRKRDAKRWAYARYARPRLCFHCDTLAQPFPALWGVSLRGATLKASSR